MAPARRSTRSKAETADNKTETAPKVPATRVAKKTRAVAAKEVAIAETTQKERVEEEAVEKEIAEKETGRKEAEEKSVRRSTRARKGADAEAEKEKVVGAKDGDKKETEGADITPAVPEYRPAPASDIGPTKPPVKTRVTRGRAAKGQSTATAPVEEGVVVDEATIASAAPAPTVRRSTRGNRGTSEAPADSTITVVPPVEKPKRGKKVTSEIFEATAAESAAAASSSATPHWAKKRESKAEEQVEPIASSGEGDAPEKTAARGKKRKAAVSKKGKGKARRVREGPEEPGAKEPEAKEPETEEAVAEISKNIDTPIKEPMPVAEEESTDNDPATNHGVARNESKHPPNATKPSKKATATAKKTAVKKAPVTRKSARGKKAEEVAQAAENGDETAPFEQTDLIAEDIPIANPQVITESSQKVNGGVAPDPAPRSSQATEMDDFRGEDADQAPKIQDSGVFIESFRSTQDKPAAIPREQVDTKEQWGGGWGERGLHAREGG